MIKLFNTSQKPRSWALGIASTALILSACLSACGGSTNSSPPPAAVTPPPSNSAPVLSGDGRFSGDENTEFSVTLTATDADNDSLTFSMDRTGDGNHFILSADGVLSGEETFDFEGPSDENSDSVYEFPVTISDGEAETTANITVTINGVNEPPVYTGPGDLYASEWQMFSETLTASDPEGDAISFELSATPDAAFFNLATGGTLSSVDIFDFENPQDEDVNNVYNLNLIMSDGELTGTTDLLVTLGDSVESDMTFKAFGLGGSVLSDFTVTLYNADESLFGEFTAEEALTLNIPIGDYRVEIGKPGYEPHDLKMCTVLRDSAADCEVELLLGDVALETADIFRINSSARNISANGQYLVFTSFETDLVENDTNNSEDVFVFEIATGEIERVSIASDGSQANSHSRSPSISGDGRVVTFTSDASNLADTQTRFTRLYIFAHDRETGVTELVSKASDGTDASGPSESSSVSDDGRYVAYSSRAVNLVDEVGSTHFDIFVYDRETSATELVSTTLSGRGGDGHSRSSSMSSDGRFVAFSSNSRNLVAPFISRAQPGDLFVRDRETGLTEIISISSEGVQGDDRSNPAIISGNGRFVLFRSTATNLIRGRTVLRSNLYVHDRETNVTELITIEIDGSDARGSSIPFAISDDGRFVSFDSLSNKLVEGDTNRQNDAFAHDRLTGKTQRISVHQNGSQAVERSSGSYMSADGRIMVLYSGSNLASDDTSDANGGFFVVTREPVVE